MSLYLTPLFVLSFCQLSFESAKLAASETNFSDTRQVEPNARRRFQ